MSADQRRLPEKFKNDILFEGEEGNLRRHSIKIDPNSQYSIPSNTSSVPYIQSPFFHTQSPVPQTPSPTSHTPTSYSVGIYPTSSTQASVPRHQHLIQ